MADKNKSTKNDDLVTLVKDRIDEGTDWTTFRQVQINRAFYAGKQWLSWNDTAKRVYEPPLRRGEIRYTYNKIKPAITTLLAKLTKNRVQLEVAPDTNDDERIEVAKGSDKFLKNQWQTDDMDRKQSTLKLYMLIDGFAALKVYADKNQGEEIPVAALADPETVVKEGLRTGKICTVVCDYMSLKVDPSAETEDEIKWCVHSKPRDVEEIEDEYGVRVAPESNIEIRPSLDPAMITDKSKKYKNMAIVNEYWEWPSRKFPNGRKITTANGELLDNSEEPGENPFIFFSMIPIPGQVIGAGVVQDMTTPQRSYNVKRTAEARILEEMGNPMWLAPTTIDDDELVNEISGIVHYSTEDFKPERVKGVEPGNGWQAAMERDEADMEDISGAHEISQGATPKGNNTYGGLQLQVEQDETKLAIAVHSYERGMQKWGEKVLRLVQKHFPEEQQLRIVGDDNAVEVFEFAGADLTGNETVDVIYGSSMPELKVAKEAKIFEMWSAGMFNDPKTGAPDIRKVQRLLGQNIASAYFDDVELDENKAKSEQKVWEKLFEDPEAVKVIEQWHAVNQVYQEAVATAQAQGIDPSQLTIQQPPMPQIPGLPVVRDFYDHETHLQVHNRFRKSDTYDNLTPALQAFVDYHCDQHEQALQAPMVQQQIQAQADQQTQQEQEASKSAQEHEQSKETMSMKHEMDMQREALKGTMKSQMM